MIASARSDDIPGAVAAKPKLSKRPGEIGASVKESLQARHVAISWPSRVVAYDTDGFANVAITAVLPSIDWGDLQTSVLQHLKQPS
jgi:hypothetical protein